MPATANKSALLANVAALLVPAMWGIYWLPLRELDRHTSAGAWNNVAVLGVACVAMAPFMWRVRQDYFTARRRALASALLGGAAFTMYADALLYGQVAVVVVLFYLTPVWSALIARLWLRWPTSPWRYAAIVLGLVGISLVLSGEQGELPLPRSIGDWLGLFSGILWSIASTGLYLHSRMHVASSNFIFCVGAFAMALVLALTLAPLDSAPAVAIDYRLAAPAAVVIGVVWWALALTAFMWAVQWLDPTRLGIFMMTEVIVGAVSAALLTDEPFGRIMFAGTALVIVAGYLESRSPGGTGVAGCDAA